MKIEINEILANMLNAMKISAKDDWSIVKKSANTFIQSKKDRLELLAILRISGEIRRALKKSFFEKTIKKGVENEVSLLLFSYI